MRTQEDILTSTIFSSKEKGGHGKVPLATMVTSTQATKGSTRSSIDTMVISILARSSISTSIMSSPGQLQPWVQLIAVKIEQRMRGDYWCLLLSHCILISQSTYLSLILIKTIVRELFEMDTSERGTLDHNQESEHFCNGGDSCCQNRPWHRCGIGDAHLLVGKLKPIGCSRRGRLWPGYRLRKGAGETEVIINH